MEVLETEDGQGHDSGRKSTPKMKGRLVLKLALAFSDVNAHGFSTELPFEVIVFQ